MIFRWSRPGLKLVVAGWCEAGRSPASKALLGEQISGPSLDIQGAEPGQFTVKATEAVKGLEALPVGTPGVAGGRYGRVW